MDKDFEDSIDELAKLDESILPFASEIRKNALDYNAWNALGNVLSQTGHYDEAMQCYDRAIEIDPNVADAWNGKGNVLSNLKRFDEAIQCYDKALEIDPSNAAAWNNKGVHLENVGKFDEAIQCYDKAIELDSRYFNGWYNKGIVLAKLKRFDEAIKCYDKAVGIDPKSPDAWYHIGFALHRMKEYEEAISCYDKAIEIDTMYVSAWYYKGLSLSNLGEYLDAIQCFDKALEIDPNNAGASYERGNAYDSLGYHDEAIESYDKALDIDPNLAKAWYKKGSILLSDHKIEEAESCLRTSLSLDEKNINALKKLHTIYSNHTNQYDKAIEIAQKLLESDPQSTEINTLYAADLIKAGKYKEGRASAQESFQKVLRDDVDSQLILRFLTISSYHLDGDLSSAEKELDKFLKYYNSLEDIYFKVEDEKLDFQGFRTLIDKSKINSQSKATLNDLLSLLQDRDRNRVLGRIASVTADANVKSRRRLKVLVPTIAALFGISIITLVLLTYFATKSDENCTRPLELVTALPQGEFTRDLRDVEIDSANNLAYVLSEDSDYAVVIDTCTNELETKIKTGKGMAFAINNATNKMYVANQDANTVSVVDLSKIEDLDIPDNQNNLIPLTGPITGDDRLYDVMINKVADLFNPDNPDNQDNLKPLTGVVRPSDIVIDKDKNRIFVANRDNNSVSIIDGFTDQPLENLPVGESPIDLDIDPKNHLVYVRSAEDSISAIRENETGYESSNIYLDYVPDGMTIDSKGILYLGQRAGKIHIIDVPAYGFKNINGTGVIPPKKIQKEMPMEEFGKSINILADPKKDLLYLVSKDFNTVSIIDTSNKHLLRTMHVGNKPTSMAVDTEGNKIYVTNEDDPLRPMVMIDTNLTKRLPNALKVDSSPSGIAFDNGTRMIYVANFDSDKVTVISGDNYSVVETIDLTPNSTDPKKSFYPIKVAIDSNRSMVYVTNFLDNSVSVIDGTKNEVVDNVPVGKRPIGLDIDPGKNMLYVANRNSSTVSVIDTGNNTVIQEVDVGSKPVDVSVDPKNHMIYVANFGSNNTSIIDGTKNNTVVLTLPVRNHPSGLEIDPENNVLYVANQDSSTISQINIARNLVNNLVDVKEINVFGNDGSGQACTEMRVTDNITAIGHNGDDEPKNVLDDNPYTGWSNFGSGSWIQTDLGTQKNICSIDIQWYSNKFFENVEKYKFVVSVSNDTANYTNVFTSPTGVQSHDLSGEDVGKKDAFKWSFNKMSSQLNSTNGTSPVSAKYIRINITDTPQTESPDIGGAIRNFGYDDPLHLNIEEWPDTIGTYKLPPDFKQFFSPTDVVFNPITNMTYVSNQDSNFISVIDQRGAMSKIIPVGKHPISLAIDPEKNIMFVANWGSDTVSISNMTASG